MLTRPSMCVRRRLVIVALGLTILKPFPTPVGFAATSPSTPTEVGSAPVAIAAASLSTATGKLSAPAGTALSLAVPAGAAHWPAATAPAPLPAAGKQAVPAAVVASPLPAAGTVTFAAPTSPLSTTASSDLAISLPGWAAPGDVITLTAGLSNRSAGPAPASTISGTLPASLVIVPGSAVGFEVGLGVGGWG